jgi:hypothetical protein
MTLQKCQLGGFHYHALNKKGTEWGSTKAMKKNKDMLGEHNASFSFSWSLDCLVENPEFSESLVIALLLCPSLDSSWVTTAKYLNIFERLFFVVIWPKVSEKYTSF